jgi:hypothetical protein
MIMNQFKKIVLSLVLLTQVSSIVSMAPAQEQGVLSALASDAAWLAKGIGSGIYSLVQGLGNTYLFARKNPVPALAVAIGVPLLGRWVYVNQYEKHIKPVADRAKGNDRIYTKWAADLWENQSAISKEQAQVFNEFKNDFGAPDQTTITGLTQEITALGNDMQELETKYLVCRGVLDCTFYNIRSEFKDAKDTHALGIGEEHLSFDQSLNIDKEMNKTINSKIIPYLMLSINYGQAAALWCKLKKAQLRLKVILRLVKAAVHGGAVITPIVISGQVQDHNIHVTASRDQA